MEEAYSEILIPSVFKDLFLAYRYKVYWGGRGGGKSRAYATALIILSATEKLRVLCARELQVSINDSVHKLLCDEISRLGLDEYFHITNTSIRAIDTGSEFLFKGLKHNASEIKSLEGVDKVWVEEAEKVSDSSWETLIPTIRKPGSEIWISFNLKNVTDATYRRFVLTERDDAVVRKVSWRDNPFFPDVLDKERRVLEKEDYEAYLHVWEGEPDLRHSGAVYAKWMTKLYEGDRINGRVMWDPGFPVYTCWDLGYDDSTAVWFYQLGYGEIMVIDYYESNGQGVGHYCDILKGKDYTYALHFVPHDAANKIMAAGGRSIIEQAWKDHGVKMTVVPATSQQNSIEALRKTLPRCWFNKEKCGDGLDALMQYAFQYDEKMETFKSTPKHDWSSHACDSLELMGRMWQEQVLTKEEIVRREVEKKFFKTRREHNVDGGKDPYVIQGWKRKKK